MGNKVLYNNDFNSEEEIPTDNLAVGQKTNKIDIAKENDNTYIGIEMQTADNCHIDRQDINTDSTWFVMEFDLRTSADAIDNVTHFAVVQNVDTPGMDMWIENFVISGE